MVPATLALGGCTIAWQGNFSYSYGQGASCAITMDWCIFQLPRVGYVGVKMQTETSMAFTAVTVRLAPDPDVTAAWSAPQVRVVDLGSNAQQEIASLPTRFVSGYSITAYPAGRERVFGASHSEADFRLQPRIRRFELRFPDVLIGGARAAVPPVQVVDGWRYPVPVPWFMGGH